MWSFQRAFSEVLIYHRQNRASCTRKRWLQKSAGERDHESWQGIVGFKVYIITNYGFIPITYSHGNRHPMHWSCCDAKLLDGQFTWLVLRGSRGSFTTGVLWWPQQVWKTTTTYICHYMSYMWNMWMQIWRDFCRNLDCTLPEFQMATFQDLTTQKSFWFCYVLSKYVRALAYK